MSNLKKYLPYIGIIGLVVIAITLIIPALAYRGATNESYSLFNHYISELGYEGISKLAIVFDIGLMICSLFLGIFIYGISEYFDGLSAKSIKFFAVVCTIFLFLIGVFPMNISSMHQLVTAVFFTSYTIMSVIYTASLYKNNNNRLPRFTTYPSIAVFISSLLFAFFIFIWDQTTLTPEVGFIRPEVWPPALFEWAILLSLLSWVLVLTIDFLRKKNV